MNTIETSEVSQKLYGLAHVPSNGYIAVKSYHLDKILPMVDRDNKLVYWDETYRVWLRVTDLPECIRRHNLKLLEGGNHEV